MKRMHTSRWLARFLAAFLFSLIALIAQTALPAGSVAWAQVSVPPELYGWEGWALHGHETHRCPWLVPGKPSDEARVCAWPSALTLQADEHGGRFEQRWEVAADSWVPLPGSTENWPENVTVDGGAAALVARDGTPALRASAGPHIVAGAFRWSRRPEVLALPTSVALVSLAVDGAPISNPQRTDTGVFLGAHPAARQDDRSEVRVFRLLDDALPAHLTTEVHLAIAGEAREIRLPAALPEGFVPTAIDSILAARLDPDNTLRVQVLPGEFVVTLEARGPSPVADVRLGARPAPWPADEVWSFKAQDRLRVVAIEGVGSIDPAQANVPQEWRGLPAFRLSTSSVLHVVERSRGLSADDANSLQLRRTSWLDFSGTDYTTIDDVTGEMRQGWRLDMAAPYALRSARTSSGEPLLITDRGTPGLTGIELRDPQLNLQAVSRVARTAGALPATGWRTRFAHVSGQLVVAPGYRLLAAIGPDEAPQAWLERWRLLDVFAVLLIATATWRILGVATALVALGAVALTYQESGAPTWLWLAVLIALALTRAAPEGRVRRWAAAARVLALALLVLALIPFVVSQARLAVYPQLETLTPAAPSGVMLEVAPLDRLHGAKVAQFQQPQTAGSVGAAAATLSAPPAPAEEVVVTGERRAATAERYEPGVLVQAGPGLPEWRYHVYPYSWSGPVDARATARFVISPPWMTRLWRLLGLGLSGLLLYALMRPEVTALPTWWRGRFPPGVAAALVGVALAVAAAPRAQAATTPDPALIDELRTQLLEPPKCAPDCAAVLAAEVTVGASRLAITLTVSALDAVGIALPGAEPNWTPDVVTVDAAAPGWVHRSPAGVRYVNLTPGRHVVRIEGPVGATDALSLAFPAPPHVIDVSAPDWDVGGLSERHLPSGALQLIRRHSAGGTAPAASRQEEFPPFVSVDRLFHLAHDWTIETTVTRVAPSAAAFTVNLPLLATEAVTTPGLPVKEGTIAIGMAAGRERLAYTSILPRADTVELVAPRDSSHTEQWRFEVGQSWHVDFSGVPPVAPSTAGNVWIFEYYPRPGERLTLHVTRPAAAPGGTLAFDRVRLQTAVGKRSSETTLMLDYRSTQGGRQTLRLPDGATVTRVLSDGEPVPLRPEHGELSLSALPGTHSWWVEWQAPVGARAVTRVPAVTLAAPASNLQLSMQLPEDRWVLYGFGPGVGPAILYWGELLLFVVGAWLLGRSRLTALTTREWLLLGLGLSTFSWLVLGLFVLFAALFQWRALHAPLANAQRFNLLQVGTGALAAIALLAVVAAVPQGLLAHPDMRIASPDTAATLSWFVDRAADRLPAPGVLSVSLWWYKLAMLAWALWLSFALTRWVRWAWQVYTRDGLWRSRPPRPSPPPVPAAGS